MAVSVAPEPRLHVVVRPVPSATETVDYALREARDWQAETERSVTVEALVVGEPTTRGSAASRSRIVDRLETFESETGNRTTVTSIEPAARIDEARTTAVLDHLADRPPTRVIIEADDVFDLPRIRDAFGVTAVELAPTTRRYGRRRLVQPGGPRRIGTLFVLTYGFYLAIGGFAGGLDLLTGAVSAAVVAVTLSHVTFLHEPSLRRTGVRLLRFGRFFPVLLWEVVKANLVIAAVILHPRLPITPSMWTYESSTETDMERMVLANSITLTPGTLAVDVRGPTVTVHSLTTGAREDLVRGRLARQVGWVFHGTPDEDGERTGEDA